ncbi:hypothetical protein C0J52_24063, partial [Blattella germanica]
GQPEFTNEDLEEELTEVRPLDIPLHLLQVETVEEHDQDRYATSTIRAFGELDLGGLTTVSSRLSELHMREELEADFRSYTDFGDWDQDDDDFKSEEANHSGDHSEEDSQETKETSTPDREEWSPLTTSTPETARGALERDFATFLRNGSPEMEEHESRNVSEEAIEEDERNKSSRHKESEEAEFDTVHKLEQVRELDKKANIPQKLVDSVSPKADEDLLELMVRIAENPAEWQRVHNVLRKYLHNKYTFYASILY